MTPAAWRDDGAFTDIIVVWSGRRCGILRGMEIHYHAQAVWLAATALVVVVAAVATAATPKPIDPLLRAVDLDVGESRTVRLSDGTTAEVKLISLDEQRCPQRNAVRGVRLVVQVNGQRGTLGAAMYHLPTTIGGVQIDCCVTRGYIGASSKKNVWALDADARFRLWPKGSPWIRPGTFVCPVRAQRWLASDTQMANDPCYVNACDTPGRSNVYYHYGLDFGGVEGLDEIIAATDGVVVSRAGKRIAGDLPQQVNPRHDVVYIRDGRGWFYRYSHLKQIDPAVRLGEPIRKGDKVGLLGKEGGSGGWSHLHFDITMLQPSGRYGITDGYALAFAAYCQEHKPTMIAVARPHRVAWVGQPVELDATRSWHVGGVKRIVGFEWSAGEGGPAGSGPRVSRVYSRPGHYTEVLKITDDAGHVAHDFAVVQVFDRAKPLPSPPAIHAAYRPTLGVRPGDTLTFKVRTFGVKPDEGEETWDFGDGTPHVRTHSDGNARQHAPDGYAVTRHAYARPGRYIATVRRTNARGQTATARLLVHVGGD